MANSKSDRRWGSKDLRAKFCGGEGSSGWWGARAAPGAVSGYGGSFTKMGGPYTASLLEWKNYHIYIFIYSFHQIHISSLRIKTIKNTNTNS